MLDSLSISDIKNLIILGVVIIGILLIWAIISSFVTVVDGSTIYEDKKDYNKLMQSYKEKFKDIFENENYTEVKRSYLLDQLEAEITKINQKIAKKYIGAVVKDKAKVHNIETFPGEIPNNVFLKLPTGEENSFIWCIFNDSKNRYIDFDKGEEVEMDGTIDRINLVPSKLQSHLDENIDKLFKADFAIHLQDDANMKKIKKN